MTVLKGAEKEIVTKVASKPDRPINRVAYCIWFPSLYAFKCVNLKKEKEKTETSFPRENDKTNALQINIKGCFYKMKK